MFKIWGKVVQQDVYHAKETGDTEVTVFPGLTQATTCTADTGFIRLTGNKGATGMTGSVGSFVWYSCHAISSLSVA